MAIMETVAGSPYEMGCQQGRAFRHIINNVVHELVWRHSFAAPEAELEAACRRAQAVESRWMPWMAEELMGLADGSGLPYRWLRRMHLRLFNSKSLKPRSFGESTAFALRTGNRGLVLAGLLDDLRFPFVILRRAPRDGLAHVMIAWAGTGWGTQGLNAAGLAVVFVPRHPPDGQVPWEPAALYGGLVARLLLESCRTTQQAIDWIQAAPIGAGHYVIGDASGRLTFCRARAGRKEVQIAAGDRLWCTSHYDSFDFTGRPPPKAAACPGYARSRDQALLLAAFQETQPQTLETVQHLIQRHPKAKGGLLCHPGAFATLAVPQQHTPQFQVAERPFCRNPFVAYNI